MGRPSHPRYDPSSPKGPRASVPPTPRTAHTLYDLDKGSLVVRIEVPAEEATDVLAHLSKAGIVFDAEPRSDDEPETMPLRIVAVGAGVVGTAAGAALRDLGHDVVFADIDESVLTR